MTERTARPPMAAGPITEEAIRDLVHTFYARVRSDPTLGPVFEARLADRWAGHLERMCAFWSSVLLGTRRFQGDPMGAHLGLPGIEAAHFDRWMELFRVTAADRLPEHLALDVAGRAARMRVALERAACPPPTARDGPGVSP